MIKTLQRGNPVEKPWRVAKWTIASLLVCVAADANADREPVLKQIDVPHSYYFREMYLPQLTSGPSALAWSPDGESIVYSMQGSLWRQRTDSPLAVQLTDGPGYDYQPDWSPDGRQVVFVRYDRDAMELHVLDVATGTVRQLTNGGDVNIEPRWSPDGSRLAYVSTRDTGRFHVFTGTIVEGALVAAPLLEERQSAIPRYYYSSFDHELSPAWSADGEAIFYVGNAEIPYGSGAIWMRPLAEDAEARLVRREETTWKARPDAAPDGRRIAYSSYLGRQWHQLWVSGIDGVAEPFPLTYGEFDITAARWSPDGNRIAYIANEGGNTEIRVQEIVGGRVTTVAAGERRYLRPVANLNIGVVDENGVPVAARVALIGSDGRSYAPAQSWIHADDGFDRTQADFETHYFHVDGEASITLPPGPARVTVWRGLEHEIERRLISISAGAANSITIQTVPLELADAMRNWVSGDVHVHMNYGGTYRNTPPYLVQQATAEDLDVVFNLIVNKEQRVPDVAYFSATADAASSDAALLLHAQEFHTSFWGHLGLLGLKSHLLIPDYSAYPGTAAASIFPDNATISRLAREQDATVGYVHPFYAPPDPAGEAPISNALPVDAALGLVDYYEVVGFAYHRPSAEVWYRLQNCGIRLAAAGGTDAMANYASLRGPVGVNRTYVQVDAGASDNEERRDRWLDGLRRAHSFATNGPLLSFEVNGSGPGGELRLERNVQEVTFSASLRSVVPIDHLEVVMNGKVVQDIALPGDRTSADFSGRVPVDGSGWLLLRAWNDDAHPLIFDIYPYATTSAIGLTVAGQPQRSRADADYFIAWIERIRESVEAHQDFNNAGEKAAILSNLASAERFYQSCR